MSDAVSVPIAALQALRDAEARPDGSLDDIDAAIDAVIAHIPDDGGGTTEYTVTWAIDVEADTPQQAAEAAMEVMLNPSFDTAIFRVDDGTGEMGEDLEDTLLISVPYPAEYGRAKCSLSFCDDLMYATHEDDGVRIDLCQHHYDEIAR